MSQLVEAAKEASAAAAACAEEARRTREVAVREAARRSGEHEARAAEAPPKGVPE